MSLNLCRFHRCGWEDAVVPDDHQWVGHKLSKIFHRATKCMCNVHGSRPRVHVSSAHRSSENYNAATRIPWAPVKCMNCEPTVVHTRACISVGITWDPCDLYTGTLWKYGPISAPCRYASYNFCGATFQQHHLAGSSTVFTKCVQLRKTNILFSLFKLWSHRCIEWEICVLVGPLRIVAVSKGQLYTSLDTMKNSKPITKWIIFDY